MCEGKKTGKHLLFESRVMLNFKGYTETIDKKNHILPIHPTLCPKNKEANENKNKPSSPVCTFLDVTSLMRKSLWFIRSYTFREN